MRRRWPRLLGPAVARALIVSCLVSCSCQAPVGPRDASAPDAPTAAPAPGGRPPAPGGVPTWRPGSSRPLRWLLTPYLPSDTLVVGLRPVAHALSSVVGSPVQVQAANDYAEIVDRLVAGQVELVTLSAFSYLDARRRSRSIVPLAMQVSAGSASYQGYIVTTLPEARTLSDLRGRRFCWVDRDSTSGYVLPRAVLRRRGLDPDTFFASASFGGSHRECLDRVLSGATDGAALFGGLLTRRALGADWGRLRILAKTERVPNDLVVASPALAPEVQALVRSFLLATSSATKEGRRLLGAVPVQGWLAPPPDGVFDRLQASVEQVPGGAGRPPSP